MCLICLCFICDCLFLLLAEWFAFCFAVLGLMCYVVLRGFDVLCLLLVGCLMFI